MPTGRLTVVQPEGGPTEVLPLAFHVGYRDKLGWVDRFAKPEFTERQHPWSRLQRKGDKVLAEVSSAASASPALAGYWGRVVARVGLQVGVEGQCG